MTTDLRLETLGTLRVARGDDTLTGFVSNKAPALLCYLAVTGRPHTRSALAALLWTEMPEEDARRSLRVVLANLRQVLAPHLHITRETIAFDRTRPYWLDVERFEAALQGPGPGDALDGAVAADRLRAAVALYRGDFLDGFYARDAPAFEEWATVQRERLRQRMTQALHGLIDEHSARGDYAAGIDACLRLLALDPWREDAHRRVIRLLALSGQPDAALRRYEHARRILADALGAEPEAETTALVAQIRAGTLDAPPPVGTRDVSPCPGAPQQGRRPIPPTPLLGRAADLAAITALLGTPACRLLTLRGPAGIGKTRLALEVATTLDTEGGVGVFFVDLTPVSDPGLVTAVIAQALGIPNTGTRTLLDALIERLGDDTARVLVLDNFEQVLDAATIVSDLLAQCPRLTVLVTSRASLQVRGEQDYVVTPLAVPPLIHRTASSPEAEAVPETLTQYAAVALFCQRAAAVVPTFHLTAANAWAVARICVTLDGLPLAIELAAARSRLLAPAALLERLERRLTLLTNGAKDAPRRQRTLRDAIGWSYDLLDDGETWLFRRLAVFVGGFSLEAAEAVCGARAGVGTPGAPNVLDAVEALVGQSLVWRQDRLGGEPRFGMLLSIREYGLERLDAETGDDATALRDRHAQVFLALCERAETHMYDQEQVAWLDRIEVEHDNIRAAHEWLLRRGLVDLALRLTTALRYFWFVRGYHREGRDRLVRTLARPEVASPTLGRARALNAAGYLQWVQGNQDDAHALLAEAVRIGRAVDAPSTLAFALCYLGAVTNARKEFLPARALLEESLALCRAGGDRDDRGLALMFLGDAAVGLQDAEGAWAAFSESARCFRATGNSSVLPYPLRRLGYLALARDDRARALTLCLDSMTLNAHVGDRQGVAASLVGVAAIAQVRGQMEHAVRLLGAAEALVHAIQTHLLPFDHDHRDEIVAQVRARLGAARFAAGWAEGRAMTLEQAMAAARRGDQIDAAAPHQGSIAAAVVVETREPSCQWPP